MAQPTAKKDPTLRLPIAEIVVGERHRKYLGDIEGLAESIAANGLLHPVVITPTRELIAGERRLLAAEHLGWTTIPVTIIDPPNLLAAEADENTQRLDFSPTEAVEIAKLLRPIEAVAAKERQREHAGTAPGKPNTSVKLTEVSEAPATKPKKKSAGESRSKVAAAVGMSPTTLAKAEAVVAAAEKDPELGAVVAKMDETGKVDAAFKELKKKQDEEMVAKRDRSLTDEERNAEEIARLRVVWSKGMADLAKVLMLDPAKYIPIYDTPDTLPGLVNATRAWLDRIDSELGAKSGLRLIGGAKR